MKRKIQYTSVLLCCSLLLACQPTMDDSGVDPFRQQEKSGIVEPETIEEAPELLAEGDYVDDIFKQLEAVTDFDVAQDEHDSVFLEQRQQLYKTKEVKWSSLIKKTSTHGVGFAQPDEFKDCYQLVHSLNQGYQSLQSGADQGYFPISKYDIRFLSEQCDTVFAVQALYLPEMVAGFKVETAERGREIVYYYEEKQDAQRIVLAVENLQNITDGELSAELNHIYGRALVKMGRLDDAAQVLTLVVQGLDPREQWPLRLEIAELLIASGEYEQARVQYLAIAEVLSSWEEVHKVVTDQLALLYATDDHTTEIALYTQCLHAYLAFDGQSIPVPLEQNLQHLQAKYPGGIHADAALRLYQQAEEQTRDYVGRRLLDIQELADEKQFQQGLDILAEMKQSRIPDDAIARIDEMIIVVSDNRGLYVQQERERRTQARADKWQEGLNLLDMQMYDESIAIFSELLGSEYDHRAALEIEKSGSLAAIALRKEAANLFVRARRTKDYNGRINLLNQSRRLLEEILEKYPQVDLAEKVAVNLSVIKEQLDEMAGSED